MMRSIDDVIHELERCVTQENYMEILEELCEEIEENHDAKKAIEPILKIIENNPDMDFGSPGPLVHTVEKFYKDGYEEKLIDSLKRRPTQLSVWMLNRIINGEKSQLKEKYIGIMKEISDSVNLESDIVELAKHFLTR